MVKRYTIVNGRVAETEETDSPIALVVNPTDSEKRFLIDELKIDEHTLNSSLDPDELSRLEFEPEHIALIYKRPKYYSGEDQFLFRVTSAGLFLFKDKLIVVISEDVPVFEGRVFQKVNSLRDITLKLLYRSSFHFVEHLKVINAISDELEQKINQALENKYLINLFTLEKSLVYYLNALNSNGVLIEKLRYNSGKLGLLPEESEFLEDIIVENNQCYRQAEIYSNILASLMDARVSVVSNNLNVLMKTLNIITIGIMVPTLVVSIFSMNVKIPFESAHPFSFWIIMGLAFIAAASFLIFWRFKKW
jgi:magnesium transporter